MVGIGDCPAQKDSAHLAGAGNHHFGRTPLAGLGSWFFVVAVNAGHAGQLRFISGAGNDAAKNPSPRVEADFLTEGPV